MVGADGREDVVDGDQHTSSYQVGPIDPGIAFNARVKQVNKEHD